MEEAVHSMPRTKHRLHIFKHRIMIKAKLGMDVTMDIQRFKEEPEEVRTEMDVMEVGVVTAQDQGERGGLG